MKLVERREDAETDRRCCHNKLSRRSLPLDLRLPTQMVAGSSPVSRSRFVQRREGPTMRCRVPKPVGHENLTAARPPYRRAIRWILGRKVRHRRSQDLNNLTEQDHRSVTQRDSPMLGFRSFESAARCCSAFDELRQSRRVRQRRGAFVPLAEPRRLFRTRWRSLIAEMAAP